jgi:hypothetical protein
MANLIGGKQIAVLNDVTSTASELNILDGVTSTAAELNLVDGSSAGTVVNSKGVVYSGTGTIAGALSTAAQGNVTSLGTLTTLTVDDININGTNIGHTSDTDAIAIASSGNVTVSQDLSVSGDLTVSGTTTTVDSTVLTVVDPIIHLQTASGGGALGSDTNKDVGLALQYHTGSAAKTAFLGYDDSAGKLTFIPDATLSSEVVSGTVGTIVADLEGDVTGTLQTAAQGNVTSLGTLTTLTVDNVLINGTTIGHTSDTDLLTLASGIVTVAGELQATTLDIGGTNVTSTATELNLLDGSTAGSVVNSKAVVYSGAGAIAGTLSTAAQGNITSLGTLTTLTVDNVAINGATIGHTGDTDLMTLASGILTVAGEISATTLDIGGTNVTSTAAELNKLDGMSGTAVGTTDTQTLTNKTLTSPAINTGVSGSAVLDEDDMASDSATQLATQQSIKAYTDATSSAMAIALG